jgi:2-hydroxy-6-oxonona-2,4-dienedioate hydrolase
MSIKRETYISTAKASYFTRIYQTKPMETEQQAIVLVHGLGISGTYMHLLAKELAEKYLVYVPDLPGFGYSSKPPQVLTMQELADALYDWAEAANVPKAFYLGNSTGCQVITDFAIYYSDKVKGVILQGPTVDPSGRTAATQIKRFIANSPLEPPSQMLIMMKDYLLCGIKRVKKTFEYALLHEIEKYLPKVNVPALVVRGEKDKIITQEWAMQAAELLPQGKLRVIPEAAHTVNYDMPEQLAQVTDEFIEKVKENQYEMSMFSKAHTVHE